MINVTLVGFLALLASVQSSQGHPLKDCNELCQVTASCKDDLSSHGTYCKEWQDGPVCFGLYWLSSNSTAACFQPNDSLCPEDNPVRCEMAQETSAHESTRSPVYQSTETYSTAMPPDAEAGSSNTSTVQPESLPTSSPALITSAPSQLAEGPNGDYCGSFSDGVTIRTNLSFGETLSVAFSGVLEGSISNLSFSYIQDTGKILITDTQEYRDFLFNLPLVLVPEDIDVKYDKEPDHVMASILGAEITTTKTDC